MKGFKKGLLTLTVLAAMSLMAEEDPIIYVNTFADEDINDNKCSLREAVIAASTHKAYNGCPKGQRYTSLTNIIQLEAGTYTLNSELVPNSSISIKGKEPADYSKKDYVSNDYPAQKAVETIIDGNNATRIINTTFSEKPAISLSNLKIINAKSSGIGGALLLGGETTLTNVSILNSSANKGGAIYLNDNKSSLTISAGEFRGNKATTGSVIDMSCLDSLNYTARNIALSGSTYIQNGSNNDSSMFEFCGQPNVSIISNTITENIAHSSSGKLIKFNSEQLNNSINLSSSSKLAMVSNTIVKNNANAIISYDQVGIKNLSYNILGFNTGKSCYYTAGDIANTQSANISLDTNALSLDLGNDQCELPKEILANAQTNTLSLAGLNFEDVLSTLQAAQDFTSYMPMYFPKDLNSAKDFVDVGKNGCAKLDQRGFTRSTEIKPEVQGVTNNTCDLGSVENLRFSLNNIAQTNEDLVKLLDYYQSEIDLFSDLVKDKNTKPEFLPYYKIRLSYFENLKKNIGAERKYRAIYFDPFSGNSPDELLNADGSRKTLILDTDNYDVITPVEVLGIGKLDTNKVFQGIYDNNLKCEWNPTLKHIVMYRTDDRVTPSGDTEFCKYTIQSKATKKIESAYLMGNFVNILPKTQAETSYVIEHGTLQKITVDPLKNANDDGDGSTSSLVNNRNKSPFYLNFKGEQQAIRFVSIPDSVAVAADRMGPCPAPDTSENCMGGNITIQLKNTLDPFNYTLRYVVYDADGMKSSEAKILLKNTAVAPNSVRKSGGGSIGWFSVLALLALGAFKYQNVRKKNKTEQ